MTVGENIAQNISHVFSALKISVQGIKACFRHEVAFRQECAIAIPHFIFVLVVPMELWMRFYLIALWFVMIAAELLNTAVEAIVDLTSPERNSLAKKAKDCGSAAVFCVIVLLALSWLLVVVRLSVRRSFS